MQGKQFVTVDQIAVAFRISERAVQKLVIYDGMPRKSRGEYDFKRCLTWYAAHLHAKVCGCAGPCNGIDPESRKETNARAERRKALREIVDLAPDLVGLKAKTIRNLLTKAIEDSYDI